MIDVLLTLLSVVSFLQVGLVIDFYFLQRRKLQFNFSKFLALGIGSLGILQLIFSLLNIVLRQNLVFVIFLSLGLPFLLDKKLIKALQKISKQEKLSSKIASWPYFFLFVFVLVLVVLTFSHTIWGSDAFSFWLAKASAFYEDGLVTKNNLYLYWPHDHPLLWPLTASWFYHFLGRVDEYYFQAIPLLILIALVTTFYQGLKGHWRSVFIMILITTPFLLGNLVWSEYVGNADLLLSFFFLSAVIFLLKQEFTYTIIFLFFAVLTKNDALPASLGFLLLFPFAFQGKKLQSWFYLAGLLLLNLFWRSFFSLESRYLTSQLVLNKHLGENIWYTANAFREEFRQVYRWGLGWWLIFFLLGLGWCHVLKQKTHLLALGLIGFQVLGYFAVYYLTPEDQASQIATSIFRLVLQIYPAALFLVARLGYNKDQYVNRH